MVMQVLGQCIWYIFASLLFLLILSSGFLCLVLATNIDPVNFKYLAISLDEFFLYLPLIFAELFVSI